MAQDYWYGYWHHSPRWRAVDGAIYQLNNRIALLGAEPGKSTTAPRGRSPPAPAGISAGSTPRCIRPNGSGRRRAAMAAGPFAYAEVRPLKLSAPRRRAELARQAPAATSAAARAATSRSADPDRDRAPAWCRASADWLMISPPTMAIPSGRRISPPLPKLSASGMAPENGRRRRHRDRTETQQSTLRRSRRRSSSCARASPRWRSRPS